MARGTTTERGYGTAHRKDRAKWKLLVDGGHGVCCEPICLMSSRWIPPGSEWHLAHTDDGTAVKGVSHKICNVGDGGRRSWGHGIAARRTGQVSEPKPEPRRWRPARFWLQT